MVITESSEPADVWEKVVAKIATQLPPASFLEFLEPTVGLNFDDTSFTVAARNSHAIVWLQRPLHLDIAQSALRTIDGSERKIIYQRIQQPARANQTRQTMLNPNFQSACSTT